MEVIKYNSTVGMLANVPFIKRPIMIKICYDLMEDGQYTVYVESAHNMERFKNLGQFRFAPGKMETLLPFGHVETFDSLAALFRIHRPSVKLTD